MAFRDLIEGDCGGSNSLVQLTSHYMKDAGFVEEGINHSIEKTNSNDSAPYFADVFGESDSGFKMDNLLSSMRKMELLGTSGESSKTLPEHHTTSSVNSILQPQHKIENISEFANQYLADNSAFQELSDRKSRNIWNTDDEYSSWNSEYVCAATNNSESFEQSFINERLENPFMSLTENRNEYDFEFRRSGSLENLAKSVVETMERNPTFENSQFLGVMRNVSEGFSFDDAVDVVQDSKGYSKWADENKLDEIKEQGIRTSDHKYPNQGQSSSFTEWAKIDEHFFENKQDEILSTNNVAGTSTDRLDEETFSKELWAKLTKQWEQLSGDGSTPWDIHEDKFDSVNEYQFAEQNPMLKDGNALREGKKRLADGDLPGAVLCFEAAVQKDKSNPEAWLLLGKTQAENEQDPKALTALKHCLNLDCKNLEALMTIAVSYTNENYQYQACYALKEWLKHNPKYSYLLRNFKEVSDNESRVVSILHPGYFQSVMDLYKRAVSQQSEEGTDPEVENGMGVLLTLNSEYEKAADHFLQAVRERPDDSRLWNRLGATLANNGKPEEALEAYRSALKLSPGFIRARYNLAITCLHLNNYKEAAEHLLSALHLQVTGRGLVGEKSKAMSDSIWSTLRLTFGQMDRQDLIPYVQTRDLEFLCKTLQI